MLRRKPSTTTDHQTSGTGTSSNASVPLGGDTRTTATTTRRRRKNPRNSCFRSCLICLRIASDDKNKTIESLTSKSRSGSSSGHRGSSRWSCCVILFSLVSFFLVTIGLYVSVGDLDHKKIVAPMYNLANRLTNKGNLVVRSTTHIPPDLMVSLGEVRPSAPLDLPILFSQGKIPSKLGYEFYYPSKLGPKELKEGEYVDFGTIDLRLLPNDDQKRQIYVMVEDIQGDPRSLDQERDDDYEQYWAFDDDKVRNPMTLYNEYIPETMEGRCRRVSWHRYSFPNCNTLHEMDLATTNFPRFVGDGAYREVFVTKLPFMEKEEELIFKELRWDLAQAVDDFEYVRMDAYITERFTSNPQIADIYGYCGLSMITEYFAFGDIEKDVVGFLHHREEFNPLGEEELKLWNNFTGTEKLKLALAMVEPLEALHNYKDGVIVHDDIQLCQYLWADEAKTKIKLNDFNRAEIMLWDEKEQKYCKYKNGRGHGDWRAPEEYKDHPLDEKIDIWSLGNNMYSLLTGYYPFFNVEKDKEIQKKVKDGDTPEIDPRLVDHSFAEGKLVEIIERCFIYDADLRADINEIKEMLLEAIAANELHEKEEAERLAKEEQREREEAKKRAEEEERKKEEKKQREKEEAAKQAEVDQRRREEAQKLLEEERKQQEAQKLLEEEHKRASAEQRQREQQAASDNADKGGFNPEQPLTVKADPVV